MEQGREEEAGERRTFPPKERRPNTTLKRFLTFALPHFCVRFLYSRPEEFIVSKCILGAGFGGFMGIGIYYLLVEPMSLYEEQKKTLFYVIVVTSATGWGISNYFRCTTLIIAINIFCKEGRAWLLIIVMASIFAGPVANLGNNMEETLRSLGCLAELQVNHSKLLWDAMKTPLKTIVDDLMILQPRSKAIAKRLMGQMYEALESDKVESDKGVSKDLKKDSDKILKMFKETEDEIESTEGYNIEKEIELEKKVEEENKTLSTQKKFEIKTLLRCEYVIEKGVDKCHDWFDKKYEDCMSVIWLPVLNHLLCLPMKFKFLCNILNLVNIWCKDRMPFGGNFGQFYDMVNTTVKSLNFDFSSKKVVKNQSMFVGVNSPKPNIIDDLMEMINIKKIFIDKAVALIKVLQSCSFIYIFITAYDYTRKYNTNIRFDNFYVTTYFRQIDARRRKNKRRYLLPLLKGEKGKVVFPSKLAIQGPEGDIPMKEFLSCIPILIFFILVIIFDRTLNSFLHIIRKHSQVSYTFSSHHRLEVFVGGETLLARLLKRTIGALKTSSSTLHPSNITVCLPDPVSMSYMDYLSTCYPVAGLLSLCVIQVYIYRLRRVLASFYFPKREKRRVLFLYNESLRKRKLYANTKRKQIMRIFRQRRHMVMRIISTFSWIRLFIRRRCIVCDDSESRTSYVCPGAGCGTVYCQQCWRVMGRFCFACTPYDDGSITATSDTETSDF